MAKDMSKYRRSLKRLSRKLGATFYEGRDCGKLAYGALLCK